MSVANAEFFEAIELIEKEKGIPQDYMLDKIRTALLTAFKRDNPDGELGGKLPDGEDAVVVEIDREKKTIAMSSRKVVVEEEELVDPSVQLTLDQARIHSKKAQLGDVISIPVETKKFGRIAAQAAKQVIIQGIREAERGIIFDEFTSKEHEILTGVVSRVDNRTGSVSIKISSNSEYTEALLPATESIRGEVLTEGDRIKVYVVEVRKLTRGPQVLISRTHPGLVKRKSTTAPWRSVPSPGKPAAAPRWPSSPPTPRWIPSARASAPRAGAWPASLRSWAARRSTLSSTVTTPNSISPPPSPPPK